MSETKPINIEAFYKITYGLYIVSSKLNNKYNGFISNAVFQVTSNPPQIAVVCNKNNLTSEYIEKSQVFSISVLQKETNQELIKLFGYKSGKDINKFEKIKFITGKSGVPIVTENTLAWFECRLNKTVDVGSHIIFIGDLINSDKLENPDEPLTYAYYRDVRKGSAPKNAPTYIDKSQFTTTSPKKDMKKYECLVCGYIYDPVRGDKKNGHPPGTAFEDLPDDWVCPTCGTRKTDFQMLN